VRGGDAVDPVHDVERVDEPGDPDGHGHRQAGPHRRDDQRGDRGAPGPLQHQAAAGGQRAHVVGEAEQAEKGDRDHERATRPAAGQPHSHHQPQRDGDAAAPRGGHVVGGARAGNVDRGEAAQQRDRDRLGHDNDGTTAHHGAGDVVASHEQDSNREYCI